MRVRFINQDGLTAYAKSLETPCMGSGASIVLFAFNGLGEVRYAEEWKGETNAFEEIARLSKRLQTIVVAGCVTDTLGHKRKSAIVAENGKLLGVTDMLHAIDGEVASGATLRVYDTKIGKMGVVVGDDIYFYDCIQALCTCGAEFIVCPFDKMQKMAPVLVRSWAYLFGVPIFFCANGHSVAADCTGEMAFSSPEKIAEVGVSKRKEYHLIETRRRGFCNRE